MRRIGLFLLWLALGSAVAAAQEPAKSWLGAELGDVTREEAAKLGWESPRGAKIVRPGEGSPAAAAGLEPGDVVVSLDGVEVDSKAEFTAAIGGRVAGAAVKLRLIREGKEKTVSVTLAGRPVAGKSTDVLPVLDTGGHMALIRSVVFTSDGKQLISASYDKTIRVWDLATGKTMETIRGEAEPGNAGMLYAMALSPDGKWLAAAGLLGGPREESDAVRLYDFPNRKIVALLKGHSNVVNTLAFSSDSTHLISGSGDNTAIIWDVTGRKLEHRLQGHTAEIFSVAFSPDGKRAVTGSYDHDVRLWSVENGGLLRHMPGHGDKVQSVAVAPDGKFIVSGDWSGEIRVWDGQTGEFRRPFTRQETGIGTLSFSPDGTLLLAGAAYTGPNYDGHVYEFPSGQQIAIYKGHPNQIIASAISPDGRWAATAGPGKEIHIWDPRTGTQRQGADGKPLVLRGTGRSVWAVGFSADGRRIGWGDTFVGGPDINDRGPLHQSFTLPTVFETLPIPQELGQEPAGAFSRAVTKHDNWSIVHKKGGNYGFDAILEIKEGAVVRSPIELDATNGYGHYSYTFTPDGKTVISGAGNGEVSAHGLDGKKQGDFVGHEGVVWGVAVSPDGKYLVTGSDDQTVRLWSLKTHKLIVTLFYSADGEWVMWTPQGYYAASGPGSELIGWQINRGPENAPEYVTAAQLRKYLNRPDIVTKAIILASAEEAASTSPGTDFKLDDLLTKPVPRFRIVSPAQNAVLHGGKAEVAIVLEATPDPVKLIRIQVNGSQVAEHEPQKGGGFKAGKLTFEVPLSGGTNTIRILAANDTGETPAEVTVAHQGKGALDKLGVLYILSIGIDKYPGLGKNCFELDGKTRKFCDLRSAGADAKAFAEAMATSAGPLHERTVKRVLVNGAAPSDVPTAANILDALGIMRKSGPNDTIMLFVSGHGFTEAQSYRILATDAAYSGGVLRESTVVPWVVFQERIEAAKGRRILFLDTCHSGNSYNQRLSNDSYAANIIVYSAARWDQDALEDYTLGHGLFTYAVVQGIKGAAKNVNGEVNTESLRNFLRQRVRELAKKMNGDQEPQYFRGRDAQDYLLALGS